MKKFISWLGAFVVLTSTSVAAVSCVSTIDNNSAVDFSGVKIPNLTIRVDLNSTFREVLQTNDEEDTNFTEVLMEYVNDFATENNLKDLILNTDYQFAVVNIDQYAQISKYQTIQVKVSAFPNDSKITGSFDVTVNLVAKAISIDNLNIPNQNSYLIDATVIKTFENLVNNLNDKIVKSKIIALCPDAKIYDDYGIFVQGVDLKAKIDPDKDKDKTFHINVQTVYPISGQYSKLKGASSFDITLAFK